MQTQPRSDVKSKGTERARQAARISDDAFKGGEATPRQRQVLTSPWNIGASRLFGGRKSPETGR